MKTIHFSAKCSDLFWSLLKDDKRPDEDGKIYEGYVPEFFPNGGGDYVEMVVDIETGQILNWNNPSKKDLSIFKKQ